MSFPLSQAMRAAGELQGRLAPHCQRLKVAGGIRRRVGEVDELSMVAIPLFRDGAPRERRQRSLWEPAPEAAPPPPRINAMWDYLERMTGDGASRLQGTFRRGERWGERFRQLWWEGYPVELQLADLDNWGYILLLRTGPTSFVQRYVQALRRRRLEPRGGRVRRYGRPVSLPSERDAFRLADWGFVLPSDREE